MKQTVFSINTEVSLTVKTCPTCFVIYAVPEELLTRKNNENGSWFCPNGHRLVFTKSELQKTQEALAKEKENSEYWRKRKSEVDAQNDNLNRRLSAKKGQITKIKNRVGNGVCPCCNRTFQNLQQHMSKQHPEFKDGEK